MATKSLPFSAADILVPEVPDMSLWSVVACDQYTSEPQYWQEVKHRVGQKPSTLQLVLPEIYLGKEDFEERIENINTRMQEFLYMGIFHEYTDSLIYVERTVKSGWVRKGILGKVDLLAYDYGKKSSSPIRATEGTVMERIPARVKIRENAPLELPHVMLLIDDASNRVIAPVSSRKSEFEPLYNFSLMQGGGAVKGYLIPKELHNNIFAALEELALKKNFDNKYDVKGKSPLLFAVGDGNHSLAAAKESYNKLAATLPAEQALAHPARYALVELVNLHDHSLQFEAIHRVVFHVDPEKMLDELFSSFDCEYGSSGGQCFGFITSRRSGSVVIKNPTSNLPVATLQGFLDRYISRFGGHIDYIHGEDVVSRLSHEKRNIGFILPSMDKADLFRTVILDGALPRKTFSMGEASEKRFYLEARKIR